jgi:iron complex transport system permease protein
VTPARCWKVKGKVGDFSISLKDLFLNNQNHFILFNIRFPRILSAIICGASLGIAGAVMQTVLKNPLASPFTLGISHGALFGVSVAVVFFNNMFLIESAFLGALSVMIFILIFGIMKNFATESLILAGVAFSALYSSGSMFLQYFSDETQLSAIINWSFGDLGRGNFKELIILFFVFFIIYIYFYLKSWDFNAFSIKECENIGVNKNKILFISLILVTILTSICVAYFGIIGFIGLISPHIAKIILNNSNFKYIFPLSAIIGALLLLIADDISRIILSPVVIPVGIFTSFIGAPMFLYLLFKLHKE